jgi:amidase
MKSIASVLVTVAASMLLVPAYQTPPVGASSGPASSQDFALQEATVAELQQRMTDGRDTARSLAERYLARIAELDRAGPSLRSVIELNPDALAIADALDAERAAHGPRGPLHGIPVLLKDNIATGDRMSTTAGSLALEGCIAPRDSFVAKQLRAAGAVILGKTNLSEWANFRSTHPSSGWSGRGGQTRNPYALDRNPSGSSSGSAVAVAANLVALAVGTETDGSIVSPASCSGLVGIKPTLGLVSRTGIVPLAHSQDTAGPMARTVTDAALLLGALAGPDPDDAITLHAPGSPGASGTSSAGAATAPATDAGRAGAAATPPTDTAARGARDFTTSLVRDGLRGARLGVVRTKLMGYSPATDRVMEAAIADLRRLGAVIVDPADIPTLGQFDDSELDVLLHEFKADLAAYFAWLGPRAPMHSLADVIAFDTAHADRELPYFGQELFEMAQKKGPLTEPAYLEALAKNHRLAGAEGIDAVMDRNKLDALIAPTGSPAWLTDLVNGDASNGGSSSPAAVAGYPDITVPMGAVDGLPVGISFFGRAWSEPTLIKLAYAYEQGTRHREPPTFRATATP